MEPGNVQVGQVSDGLATLGASIHLGQLTAGMGAGMVAIGAGIGVGLLVAAAVMAIARQPEAANKIQTVMFIGAALIEGVALFCAVICFLALKS